jgi:DNA modification methylase
VCRELGRRCLGIEMKPEYAEMARHRLGSGQQGIGF